jgi:7-cyano-7-deazaguanine synthase
MKAIVVLSGGQDSTTVLYQALQSYLDVFCITFNYDQRHVREIDAARNVVSVARGHYPEAVIEHEVCQVPNVLGGMSPLVNKRVPLEQYTTWKALPDGVEKTFVPLRNQLFLTLACNRAALLGADIVAIGVSQEDYGGYPDCRSAFLDAIEVATNAGLRGVHEIRITAPLLKLTKAETVRMAVWLRGCMEALAWTHTAYDGAYPPTGKDHATLLRAKGFEIAGYPDPLVLRAYTEGLMTLPKTSNYSKDALSRLAATQVK